MLAKPARRLSSPWGRLAGPISSFGDGGARYVLAVNRRLGALACIGCACWYAGCGGGGDGDLLSEKGVRECLAKAGIGAREAQQGSSAVSGFGPIFAPDFIAHAADGTSVAILVQSSAARARATAAHVRSAFASLGSPAAGRADRVISDGNAVAVFSRAPSRSDQGAVRRCLAG
jgi:hypothetical protein